jgi:uncharacterized membrane protein YphA (DoxX/SURF4 family)
MDTTDARLDSTYERPPSRTIHAEPAPASEWTALQVFTLRAVWLYFALYYLEGQVGNRALPGILEKLSVVSVPLDWLTNLVVPWVGAHVFGATDLSGGGPGTGDSPREWIQTFSYVVIAVVVAGIWTRVRPRLRHPQRAHAWLRAFVRYPLAFTMIDYGVVKFAGVQFGTQPFQQLMTPLGQFSPPALMWAFMTSSFGYRAFAAQAEVVGGALLLSRRTTTLGALIVLAAMSNVLAMNLAYDVSVKMMAGHLVLMAAILLLPDVRRLGNVLVLNRTAWPAQMPALVDNPRLSRTLAVAAVVYAAYGVGSIVWYDVSLGAQIHSGPHTPLAGIFDVESLTRNGRSVTDASDTTRWSRVAIETTGFMTVQLAGDRVRSFMTFPDSAGRRIVVIIPSGSLDPRFDYRNYYVPLTKESIRSIPVSDTTRRFELALEQTDPAHVRLRGRLQSDSVDIVLRRADESKWLLHYWGGTHLVNRMTFSDTWIVAPYRGWPVGSGSDRSPASGLVGGTGSR